MKEHHLYLDEEERRVSELSIQNTKNYADKRISARNEEKKEGSNDWKLANEATSDKAVERKGADIAQYGILEEGGQSQ